MIILDDAYLLTLDAASTQGRLSIAIENDRIAAVGSDAELHARFPNAETLSCRDRVVMPGLINAHLHPELIILKGIVEELDLHAWTDHDHFDPALATLSTPEHRALLRA